MEISAAKESMEETTAKKRREKAHGDEPMDISAAKDCMVKHYLEIGKNPPAKKPTEKALAKKCTKNSPAKESRYKVPAKERAEESLVTGCSKKTQCKNARKKALRKRVRK